MLEFLKQLYLYIYTYICTYRVKVEVIFCNILSPFQMGTNE